MEERRKKAVVLAMFVPLIISSGGNTGTQAASLLVRALALEEVVFKDWWRVARKELLTGLVLGSVLGGLGFMWNPQPEKLWEPETWLAASGQIFFSLSVGFGIVINYASYLRQNDDVVLSGLTASSMNEFFEVCLGGLITLPAAFIFLGTAAAGFGTFGLGFNALPNVFAVMPGGQFFGFLWFFMLFVAAITSSLSMLQPVIAFFEEGLGLKRHASATLLGLVAAMGAGFVAYFSEKTMALETFDFWVGTLLIFILAFVQAVLYGWGFGIERGEREDSRRDTEQRTRIATRVLLLGLLLPRLCALLPGLPAGVLRE